MLVKLFKITDKMHKIAEKVFLRSMIDLQMFQSFSN